MEVARNVMLKLYWFWCIPIKLMLYWHGEDRDCYAAKIVCTHRRASKLLTDYNRNILNFHLIYDYFALLKAFYTNTPNFHQYFKDKLSSHQPSHMHNTRHRINSNLNILLSINHSKTQKCFLYHVIPIWNNLPCLLNNCTSTCTFKKTNKKATSYSISILTFF